MSHHRPKSLTLVVSAVTLAALALISVHGVPVTGQAPHDGSRITRMQGADNTLANHDVYNPGVLLKNNSPGPLNADTLVYELSGVSASDISETYHDGTHFPTQFAPTPVALGTEKTQLEWHGAIVDIAKDDFVHIGYTADGCGSNSAAATRIYFVDSTKSTLPYVADLDLPSIDWCEGDFVIATFTPTATPSVTPTKTSAVAMGSRVRSGAAPQDGVGDTIPVTLINRATVPLTATLRVGFFDREVELHELVTGSSVHSETEPLDGFVEFAAYLTDGHVAERVYEFNPTEPGSLVLIADFYDEPIERAERYIYRSFWARPVSQHGDFVTPTPDETRPPDTPDTPTATPTPPLVRLPILWNGEQP